MHRSSSVALVCLLLSTPLLAVDGDKAQYVGGTIQSLKEKTDGRFITSDDKALSFAPSKGAAVQIPYEAITELEYGQKAGRRVAVGVLISPLALFSKKRNHYLTITYKDDAGKEQAGVFELGKDIVRTTLKILETRSHREIQYQDDEARKSIGGGKGK